MSDDFETHPIGTGKRLAELEARWCESGEIAWCEFVRDDDPEGRTPGTYVAVRLDNPDAAIRRMHVTITEEES